MDGLCETLLSSEKIAFEKRACPQTADRTQKAWSAADTSEKSNFLTAGTLRNETHFPSGNSPCCVVHSWPEMARETMVGYGCDITSGRRWCWTLANDHKVAHKYLSRPGRAKPFRTAYLAHNRPFMVKHVPECGSIYSMAACAPIG